MLRTNNCLRLFQHWRQLGLPALLLLMAFAFGSCKHEVVKPDLLSDYEVGKYSDAFEVLWKGINTNYVYWEQDPLNWDSIHAVYRTKFAAVDSIADTDGNAAQNLAFQYMVDMTRGLKDGNYALQVNSGGDYVYNDSAYKSMLRFIPKLMLNAKTHPVLPDTLFDYIMQYNYLNDFDYGQYRDLNTLQIFQAITGTLSKSTKRIEYLGLNSFMMKAGYNLDYSTRPPVRPVMKNFFSTIRQSSCAGFVLDLRNNRGGNLEDIDFFVGQLTTQPLLFGYVRYKSGTGRLDYTPLLPMYVQPQPGAVDFKKKIVILTDVYTASLSEKVIMALKALPGATVVTIGDPTYGSGGLISTNGIATNSGSFNIPGFGAVNLSNMAVQDTKHQFTLGGMAPDVKVGYDASSLAQMLKTGTDIQMEAAIRYFNQ